MDSHFGKRHILAITVAALLYGAVILGICIFKYATLRYTMFDLGIINQVFWNTLHGDWFGMSIHQTSYLAEHFKPIILLLLPFYALAPHPVTLLVLQALALALGVIPLVALARRLVSPTSAVAIALLYLGNPVTWYMALYEFHLFPFAVPLVLAAAYYYHERRLTLFLVWAGAALLVREEVPLMIFMFGIIALIDRRPWRWVLAPTVGAGAYFIVAQSIIAAYAPWHSYKYLTYFSWLGTTMPEVVSNLVLHIDRVVAHIATVSLAQLWVAWVAVFLFLPLVRPKFLLLGLPNTLIAGLHVVTGWFVLRYHHATPFLISAALAAVYGLRALEQSPALVRRFSREPYLVPLIALTAIIYLQASLGPLPGALAALRSYDSDDARVGREVLDMIPSAASVLTSSDTLAPLSSRGQVYSLWYAYLGKQQFDLGEYRIPDSLEYVVLNAEDLAYMSVTDKRTLDPALYDQGDDRVRALLERGDFAVVFARNNRIVLKKNTDTGKYLYRVYPAGQHPEIAVSMQASSPEGLEYLGYTPRADGISHFFSASEKIENNYLLRTPRHRYALGYGIYPTSKWKPGEVIEMRFYGDDGAQPAAVTAAHGDLYLDDLNGSKLVVDEQTILMLSR